VSDYWPERTDDMPLFAAPAQRHSPTSVAAAEAITPGVANACQRRVLAYLEEHGPATDEEIAAGLGMNPSTARPRRIELVRRGLVVECGTKRTASGRMASAWRVPCH
jgi:transcription initiation factor IIE alpha subunit